MDKFIYLDERSETHRQMINAARTYAKRKQQLKEPIQVCQ